MAAIYRSDPDRAPDSQFVAGELCHLVVGNRGRLLDARRTPIIVTAIRPNVGAFEIEIRAFEDAGARWELPLEDVGRFQFARDGARASSGAVAEAEAAVARFDRPLAIDCDAATRVATLRRLAQERARAGAWLARRLPPRAVDVEGCVARRRGEPALFALLEEHLAARDLLAIDRRFAASFVSNPGSGELVKGHAIVLAELGLCPYRGKVVRDPGTFDGDCARRRRAEHIVARLAFTQALLAHLDQRTPTLYRAAAADGPLGAPRADSLVSATFSRAVADAHFAGGPATTTAVLWRQVVPSERVLMTFLETPALNGTFDEAEAVLVGEPDNRAF